MFCRMLLVKWLAKKRDTVLSETKTWNGSTDNTVTTSTRVSRISQFGVAKHYRPKPGKQMGLQLFDSRETWGEGKCISNSSVPSTRVPGFGKARARQTLISTGLDQLLGNVKAAGKKKLASPSFASSFSSSSSSLSPLRV